MTINYETLRAICDESSALSRAVIDEFLLQYAAQKEGMVREMDRLFAPYHQVTKGLQASVTRMIHAQYIAHRIFKKDGLIKKYLNHAAVKALTPAQQNYLKRQSEQPWHFSFGIVIANPALDFFEMQNAISGESYLLFSPSITQTLAEVSVILWFNLLGFNGHCWQSYGPVVPYRGFEPDDIFFFGTELNATIVDENDLLDDLERNPIPYTMLISGSQTPLIINDNDQIVQAQSEDVLEHFDMERFRSDFTLAHAEGVYRLGAGSWSESPHFAAAYYVERDHLLIITAMTDRGYRAVVKLLSKQLGGVPEEPDIRVNLSMLTCIKNILGKKVVLNPYEELFTVTPDPADQDLMDRLNHLLALALPFINSGQEPDIAALAKEARVDEETAREIFSKSANRIKTLQKKVDKKRKNK